MSALTSTSFIKAALERFNFEGFLSAKIVGYEDAGIQANPSKFGADEYAAQKTHRSDKRHGSNGKSKLAVIIPKIMPMESGDSMVNHPIITLDSSCIINKKPISFSKKLKTCNYLMVTESRRLTEYATIHCKDASLKGIFKLKSKSGTISFTGDGTLSGISQLCPMTSSPHTTLKGTLKVESASISKLITPTDEGDCFDFDGEVLLHEGQSISVKWPSPAKGEEIIVVFLDGDPKKGCWLPHSPLV